MGDEGIPFNFQGRVNKSIVRTFEGDMKFINRIDPYKCEIDVGFVPGMNVRGSFYVNVALEELLFDELRCSCATGSHGGFLPAVRQLANVAALPGIVKRSIGLPDLHSGYGFAIGNVAAFDMANPESIVSPGGVGFDINCGVRLLRTNLTEREVGPVREQLAQALFDHIPVGVGSKGVIPTTAADLNAALEMGIDWSLREGYAWAEDKEHCEEFGRMLQADPSKKYAAAIMGIDQIGQVATDSLTVMDAAMMRDGIVTDDGQLACLHQDSLQAPDDLDIGVVYDVSNNIANVNSTMYTCHNAGT
eukprot:gene29020-38400_t